MRSIQLGFMAGFMATMCFACSPPADRGSDAADSAPQASTPLTTTVSLRAGMIRGQQREAGLKEFLGIPYAAPPVGELRWQPPAQVPAWEGVRDASSKGLPCMQPGGLSGFYDRAYQEMSEDCLTLNVWTRAAHMGENLPVMVWIHGGALVMGSGIDYDGAALTAKGVVLVTINYRLGPLGFFAHPELSAQSNKGTSGNQGFMDQIAALQWVQAHIAAFGGDADNVTIFGESAGSWSMNVLQASPSARGLFHQVIGQSGARLIPLAELRTAKNGYLSAEQRGLALAERFAGEAEADLAALQALPATQIISAYAADPDLLNNFDALTIVDGDVLPKQVNTIFALGEQADVPVMVGSNALEASTFDPAISAPAGAADINYMALQNTQVEQMLPQADADLQAFYPTTNESEARQSWINFSTDVMFTQPMNLWAEHMLQVSSPAYLYWWDWRPSVLGSQQYGAFHAAEVAYVFGDLSMFDIDVTPEDEHMSDVMMQIWTQFAKTGNPSLPGQVEWPAYTLEGRQTMFIGAQLEVRNGVRLRQVELITQAFDRQRE